MNNLLHNLRARLTARAILPIFHYRPNLWFCGAAGACMVLLLPLLGIIWLASQPDTPIWQHLWRTILPDQLRTTLALMVGVGVLTAIIGTGTAWLVTFCGFFGHRLFAAILLLPLAIPTYLAAYIYGDFFDSAGVVFQLWQQFLPATAYPQIASLGGAIIIMTLVLYPYVFLAARVAFIQQSAALIEAARGLGLPPAACFWRVGLPLARPAIAVGVALALMECLNDIGAVEYLGVPTLTIGVYDTWLVRGSLAGAAQMALVLLGLMVLLIAIERSQRPAGNQHPRLGRHRSLPRFRLSRQAQILAFAACALTLALGFIVPLLLLINNAFLADAPTGIIAATLHSLLLAGGAALLTALVALLLGYGGRVHGKAIQRLTRFAALGYAIPGTVLGLGVLIILLQLDNLTAGWLGVTGSIGGLLIAYLIRFLSLAHGTLENGFERVSPAMDLAARGLGSTGNAVLWRVHLPLLKPVMLAAMLLVFVDVMKELPATLILRPFDFETLATLLYTQASLGQIENAALPALLIIAIGLLPILIGLVLIDRMRRIMAHRI